MKKIQWIIYDQCNIRYIESGVTDIVFIHYTPQSFTTPIGKTTLNIRSRILEYAIAQAFLSECSTLGYSTHWIECQSYRDGLLSVIQSSLYDEVILMRPSEEFLANRIENWKLDISIVPNRQFLITPEEFRENFEKPPVMETFYRYMRRSRDILMEDGKPYGGKWNYDNENRNFDKNHIPTWNWKPENREYIDQAKKYFNREDLEIIFPVTRPDALLLLQYFLEYHSYHFGRLEDAMYQQDPFVHHSLLSTALNFGILHADEVIDAVLGYDMPISSQEGFIRQILGWREYMRQFYLAYYDDIYEQNTLNHVTSLPEKWWNYDGISSENITSLNCVDTVIARVQRDNYSHHIERLMIIGNYTFQRGYHPHDILRWFWELYTDAFEWVVVPNVLAMSQYSDGGRLATKPYISGGSYIEKMSNYCSTCKYSVKDKTCPMTYLYWDFIDQNQELYEKGRQPYVLSTLRKIDIDKIRKAKEKFISNHS